MRAQDDLDQLIEQHLSGEKPLAPGTQTMAPLLAAVQMLVQLQEIAPPPEFVRRLETFLRARIRHLNRQDSGESFPPPVS